MELQVISLAGDAVRTLQVDDCVFGRDVSDGAIYHAIRNELANRRVGTACTKTRSEVNGSHKKPWRQKGTGRARSGTKQSPVWVGGGIAFGPRPRSYNYSIPKKMKRVAIVSLLSKKVAEGRLKVVEQFSVENGKTKELVGKLANIHEDLKSVLILQDGDTMTRRAAANVPWIKSLAVTRLNAHDIFYSEQVVITENAAVDLSAFYRRLLSGQGKDV